MVSWQQHSKIFSSAKQGLNRQSASPFIDCQRAWVEIDLKALGYNVRQLKSILSPQTALMAVVKADGYGHE